MSAGFCRGLPTPRDIAIGTLWFHRRFARRVVRVERVEGVQITFRIVTVASSATGATAGHAGDLMQVSAASFKLHYKPQELRPRAHSSEELSRA